MNVVWALATWMQTGKWLSVMNALLGAGWTLLSTVIVFVALFLVHFCYLTPKRMLAEAATEREGLDRKAKESEQRITELTTELKIEREKTRPQLSGTIEQVKFMTAFGLVDHKPYVVMRVQMQVLNVGAPSDARGWFLMIKCGSIDIPRMETRVLADQRENSLIEKVDSHFIATGERARGWLDYFFENRELGEFQGQKLEMAITFTDNRNHESVAHFATSAVIADTGAKYFPGFN